MWKTYLQALLVIEQNAWVIMSHNMICTTVMVEKKCMCTIS